MGLCVTDTARALACRGSKGAPNLKLVSIFMIFFTSVIGVTLPVFLARLFHGKPVYDKTILIIKCFAAGVILSTSLVHVLPDAFNTLSDCQVSFRHPWKDFPFSGLITLIGVLMALLVDLTATSHVESHGQADHSQNRNKDYTPVVTCEELETVSKKTDTGDIIEEEELVKLKQRLVSQVLEIGIIFHSVIIGVTLGMSRNECTLDRLWLHYPFTRYLKEWVLEVALLRFGPIFVRYILLFNKKKKLHMRTSVWQAGFCFGTKAYMSFMFSVTTPMVIVLGMIMFSITGYDDTSPNALILEGLLGSLSSGILIYMALVDLIALDFFHNKVMSGQPFLKKASFLALVLGSTSMSILALWA